MLQGLAGGFYNRYYLMELEDMTEEYPTGYIRYTSTEERRMLNQMSEDYDVDSVYVLDMYQHGKVNWMLDVTLRLAVLLVAGLTVLTVREFWKRRIEG